MNPKLLFVALVTLVVTTDNEVLGVPQSVHLDLYKCPIQPVTHSGEIALPRTCINGVTLIGDWTFTRNNRRVAQFLGMPYSKQPNRFEIAKSPPVWPLSEFDATAYGPKCIQNSEDGKVVGAEGCLYLNVFSPEVELENKNKHLPVMVYVHDNPVGSGEDFKPDYLLDGDVVLVTFNYRLGLFGFLSPDPKKTSPKSQFQDHVAALRWIHENINQFGGDPEYVTIFGEGAGELGWELLKTQKGSGLVHRVIAKDQVRPPLGLGFVQAMMFESACHQIDRLRPGDDAIDCMLKYNLQRLLQVQLQVYKLALNPCYYDKSFLALVEAEKLKYVDSQCRLAKAEIFEGLVDPKRYMKPITFLVELDSTFKNATSCEHCTPTLLNLLQRWNSARNIVDKANIWLFKLEKEVSATGPVTSFLTPSNRFFNAPPASRLDQLSFSTRLVKVATTFATHGNPSLEARFRATWPSVNLLPPTSTADDEAEQIVLTYLEMSLATGTPRQVPFTPSANCCSLSPLKKPQLPQPPPHHSSSSSSPSSATATPHASTSSKDGDGRNQEGNSISFAQTTPLPSSAINVIGGATTTASEEPLQEFGARINGDAPVTVVPQFVDDGTGQVPENKGE